MARWRQMIGLAMTDQEIGRRPLNGPVLRKSSRSSPCCAQAATSTGEAESSFCSSIMPSNTEAYSRRLQVTTRARTVEVIGEEIYSSIERPLDLENGSSGVFILILSDWLRSSETRSCRVSVTSGHLVSWSRPAGLSGRE
jgi:hypothetical protein